MAMDRGFRTVAQISADLHSLVENNRQIASLRQLGFTYGELPIEAIRISANPSAPRKMLLLGSHHAREWISAEVPALIASQLVRSIGDSQISDLLHQTEVWIIPVVNPDGKEWSHRVGRSWRKNRAPIPPMSSCGVLKAYSTGVDLNRNYPYAFYTGAMSSVDPEQDIYRGPSPFSESESAAIGGLVASVNFDSAISYHSYGQYIFHPGLPVEGSCDAACHLRIKAISDLALAVSDSIKSSRGSIYPVHSDSLIGETGDCAISGDCAEWLFHCHQVLAMTIELPPNNYEDDITQEFRLDESDILPIFEENWLGALTMLVKTAVL